MPKPARNRHRQNEALLNIPQLSPGQSVARVIQACGENNYEVELDNGATYLYHLPKRLRFVAFVKRGTYVFIREDDTRGGGKVCGDIEVVVLDSHLPTLRKESYWPTRFSKERNLASPQQSTVQENHSGNYQTQPVSSRKLGDDSETDETWDVGEGNPNRNAWEHLGLTKQDSDTDYSDSDA